MTVLDDFESKMVLLSGYSMQQSAVCISKQYENDGKDENNVKMQRNKKQYN